MIIDFHAHILPGVDHGCNSVVDALRQLDMAKKAGVDVISATSHFYPNTETSAGFLLRRQKAWETLLRVLPDEAPRVVLGAEVLVCDGMDKMEGLLDLTFAGTNVILLEMPSGPWKAAMYETVEKINRLSGQHAVIAHVERYDPEAIDSLFETGVTGQLNAGIMLQPKRRRQILSWIDNRKISALGSDIHGTKNAYRQFKMAKAILGKRFERIMHRSEALINAEKTEIL